MSLTYTSYVDQVANLMVIGSTDPNFQTMLPGMIDYAEQRIYRELDLLYTQVTDATKQVSSGVREFTLSTAHGAFITVDQFNLISPAATLSSAGTRIPLIPVSPEFMDSAWPGPANSSGAGVPQYYAMRSNTLVLLGPSPDSAYYAETIGIQRPVALSTSNTSTIITQYIPDLFIAASMVFGFGYMRDFGGQSDNPSGSQSWENQYQVLFKSANIEQVRAKHESQAWTSQSPSPLAQRV